MKRMQFTRRKCRSKWPRPSPIFQNYIKSLNLPIGRMNSNRSNNDHTLPVVKPLSSVTELEDFDFNNVSEFPMDEKLLEWDDDNIQSLFDCMPCNNRGGEEKAANFDGTNIDPSAWEGKKNPGESRFPAQHKDFWTEEEDRILIAAHAEMGNKWSEIAKKLPGRT
nr:transcription factor MYB98-like [Tanacetum cinerariifolium]